MSYARVMYRYNFKASILLARERFISTPHNKWVYFQSAQCRRGAFPPSERSHSWNTTFALPYVTRSPRHVTGAGPVMLPFTSENRRWQVGDPKSTTDGDIMACVASHEHQDDNSQCYGVAHARMHGTVCQDPVMETAHPTQTRSDDGRHFLGPKAIAKAHHAGGGHTSHADNRDDVPALGKRGEQGARGERRKTFGRSTEGSGGASGRCRYFSLSRTYSIMLYCRHVKPFGVHKHKEKVSRR